MYSSYEELVRQEKYLKLDEHGHLVVDYPGELRVLDFHTHLSNLLPGRMKDPTKKGNRLKYPTLPPIQALDLSKPYWMGEDYRRTKFGGKLSPIGFAIDGIKILNDMVNGGTLDNCFASQRDNMIQRSVILPISTAKSDRTGAALELASSYPDRLVPFCSVHPLDPRLEEKISQYRQTGAKGFKLKITDIEMKNGFGPVLRLLKCCHDVGFPVLFHTGAILDAVQCNITGIMAKLLRSTRTELYGELLPRLPSDLVFIFGHSGIEEYRLVAGYMKRHPSAYAEISSQSADSIKHLMGEVGSERLLFGSDWPALPPAITLSRVLLATEDCPTARADILYRNAERILKMGS